MPVVSDAPADAYMFAWGALLAIAVLYIAVGVVPRWRTRRLIRVTRYEPPQGTSPALAAFLYGGGRCERSFAAAIVSLATNGYLQILQTADWVTVERLRPADPQLPPEESVVLSSLFPSDVNTYSFSGSDSDRLFAAYGHFRTTLHDVVTPKLVSNHVVIWLLGLTYSLTILALVAMSMPSLGSGLPLGSVGFLAILIFFGGSCFVAALRVWPATLLKLLSFMPGSRRPRWPLCWNDGISIFLTVYALAGFMFVAVLTSTKFALLTAAAVAMNVFSRYLLNAPTSSGRKALAELQAFREFLSRADADRLVHENEPGKTPQTLERYSPYAVALGVGHGWGEAFAGNLLELLQVNQAYSAPGGLPVPDNRPIVLKLFDRDR